MPKDRLAAAGFQGRYQLPSGLPPLWRVDLFVKQRVLTPWRRRFWRIDPSRPTKVNGFEVLETVSSLPINVWTYDFEPGVRHLGPMSQDFASAFGLGRTSRMIDSTDAAGVALVAIQALHHKVRSLEAEVTALKADRSSNPQPRRASMSATTPVEPETATATEDEDTEGNKFHGTVEDAGTEEAEDDTEGNKFHGT